MRALAPSQILDNVMHGRHWRDDVGSAALFGAATGGLGGAAGAAISRYGGRMLSRVASKCSFSAETPVATPMGEQAIGTLQVGDQVVAYDSETGATSVQTVEHVWLNQDHDLIDVTLRSDAGSKQNSAIGASKQQSAAVASHRLQDPPAIVSRASDAHHTETIHTTSEHPWLTVDRGWVPAGDLHAGEQVRLLDRQMATITSVRMVPSAAMMYNLQVSHLHTFAVGDGQFVVHNACFGSNKSKFDWDEIESGHTSWGARANQAGNRKTVFEGLNMRQVKQVVRGAWKARKPAGPRFTEWDNDLDTFATRQLWEGRYGRWIVRGRYNHTTDTVETAYPRHR